MPYAQWGYPVRGEKEFKEAFPADFISEAVDQTRGWFYTLLAISTMVSETAPFRNVICLGHVLDAKGEKMSKSKGNTVDPQAVFDAHGADAIRWYFLTGSPPGNSRRVGMPGQGEDPVALVHGFFNMYQNSAGFFTMYANVDGIELDEHGVRGAPKFADRPEIDRWVLSSLQKLIEGVTESLDAYDSQKAGKLLEDFMDGLSNWYIRRNRRRFWKGSLDADKLAAYDTLYDCLMTLSKLMAPFIPFLTEDVYSVLISARSARSGKDSVHLEKWPQADFKKNFDEKILHEGNTVQQAAFLGRSARQTSGVKVRQPLSRLLVHVIRDEDRKALEKNADVLLDELNVKKLEFISDSAGVLEYRVKPNLPRLGKKYGSRMKEIQEFFKHCNAREIALKAKNGEGIQIKLPQGTLDLEAEDILVESMSGEGISGAEGGGMLVALDLHLSEELLLEGLARDFVRNIQELRKTSGLSVTDRIKISTDGGPRFELALKKFQKFIEEETLGEMAGGAGSKVDGSTSVKIGEENVSVSIWRR